MLRQVVEDTMESQIIKRGNMKKQELGTAYIFTKKTLGMPRHFVTFLGKNLGYVALLI